LAGFLHTAVKIKEFDIMKKSAIIFAGLILLSVAGINCNGGQKNNTKQAATQVKQTKQTEKTAQKETSAQNLAPDFSLKDINGKTITLSDYRGKVVIIDFWDTWCPPCRRGIPAFIELYNDYKDKGLVIIGLAFGREGEQKVKDFAKEYGMNYPVAVATRQVGEAYGPIRSIPTAFIISKKGEAMKRYIGLRPKSEFEHDIQYLLDLK